MTQTDWLKTLAIIAAVGFIIFFIIWLMCGWEAQDCGGFCVYDLNLPGPSMWCSCDGGGGGGLEDSPYTSCTDPGLDITLRQDENEFGRSDYTIADIMNGAEYLLRVNNVTGAEWIENHYRAGLEFSVDVPLLCRAVETAVRTNHPVGRIWLDYSDACFRAGSNAICNPGFLGCSCYTTPYSDCAWTMDSSDSEHARCGGDCADEKTCVEDGDFCGCVYDEEGYCEGNVPEYIEGGYFCGGYCDPGYYCEVLSPTYCGCVSDIL